MTLAGIHAGETATIVGRGPSLMRLTADAFGPGPVITLNQALHHVRTLTLPNPIYTLQKDGCIAHDWHGAWIDPAKRCEGPCGAREPMIQPVEPETLLVSAEESPHCFADYTRRVVVDLQQELGQPWYTMSAPTAVLIAKLMGCTALRMLGHDAYTSGITATVESWGVVDYPDAGYLGAGLEADRLALAAGMAVEWVA